MKSKILNIILLIVLVASSIYYFFNVVSLKKKINNYKQIQETNFNVAKGLGKDNVDYYKKLAQRCVNVMSADQITYVAQQEWAYGIKINNKDFSGEALKIDGNNIEIQISEEREKFSFLPDSLRLRGQLKDFHKQFTVDTNAKCEISHKDDTYNTTVTYKITNLTHGSSIKINLSSDLKQRLRLPSTKYTIYIN